MKNKIISILIIVICALFVGKINVFAETNSKDLYNLIKSQAKSDVVNFSNRSGKTDSETNGVYITTATEGDVPVYYYRGNVNNNLIFNNMCWKIIRTTETNGIKLIYNGVPTEGKCNNTGASTEIGTSIYNENTYDNANLGYMYGTIPSTTKEEAQTNANDSAIKTYIENWYSTNFTDSNITSKLEDAVFYNDRSGLESADNNTYYSAGLTQDYYGIITSGYATISRASYYTINPSPSLKYPNNNDKFTVNTSNGNGKLKYPVGLLTLDEVILAGYNTHTSNPYDYEDNNSYLYTGSIYWTMSPVAFATGRVISGGTVGVVFRDSINNNLLYDTSVGVRPVIALSNGARVKSDQDGSVNNPYTISLYTITFNSNLGSSVDNQYIFDTNSKVEEPINPTRDGYKFDGWYTNTELTNKFNFDTIVNSDLTLYAKWMKDEMQEENPKTGNNIMISVILGSISLISLIFCRLYIKKIINGIK